MTVKLCWCCRKGERECGPLNDRGSCVLCAAWLMQLSKNRPTT